MEHGRQSTVARAVAVACTVAIAALGAVILGGSAAWAQTLPPAQPGMPSLNLTYEDPPDRSETSPRWLVLPAETMFSPRPPPTAAGQLPIPGLKPAAAPPAGSPPRAAPTGGEGR